MFSRPSKSLAKNTILTSTLTFSMHSVLTGEKNAPEAAASLELIGSYNRFQKGCPHQASSSGSAEGILNLSIRARSMRAFIVGKHEVPREF